MAGKFSLIAAQRDGIGRPGDYCRIDYTGHHVKHARLITFALKSAVLAIRGKSRHVILKNLYLLKYNMRRFFFAILMAPITFILSPLCVAQVNWDSTYSELSKISNAEERNEKFYFLVSKARQDSTTGEFIRQYNQLASHEGEENARAIGLWALGYHDFILGNLAKSITPLNQALTIYRKNDDHKGIIRIYSTLGVAYERLGNVDSVVHIANCMLMAAQQSQSRSLLSSAHKRLGEVYGNILRELDKGVAHIDTAMQNADQSDEKKMAALMYSKGSIMMDIDSETAIDVFKQAEILAERNGMNRLLVYVRQLLIFQYMREGNYPQAIDIASKNLEAAERTGDVHITMVSHIKLGELYNRLYQNDKATIEYEKASQIALENNMVNGLIAVNTNLGMMNFTEENIDQAAVYLEKAMEYYDEMNPHIKSQVLTILTFSYLEANKLEKAKEVLELMKPFATDDDPESKSGYLTGAGIYNHHIGQYNKANLDLRAAYSVVSGTGNHTLKSKILKWLYINDKTLHNYKMATKWAEERMLLNDSINISSNQDKITSLRMTAEFEKEKAVIAFKAEQERALLSAKKRRATVVGIVSSIGLALVSLLLLLIRRKNKQISKQNDRLTELHNIKDQIFQIIGHDLKNPAISFRGIAKNIQYLLKKEEYEQLSKLGNAIGDDAIRFYSLTDNLLNWASSQKDLLTLQKSDVNLFEVINENIELFRSMAEVKKVQLENAVDPHTMIETDQGILTTILRNLIDNALKYTYEGGKVMIKSETSKGISTIHVVDSGTGMTEDRLAEVMKNEYIVSQTGTQHERGSGIGLSIVKNLLKKLEGVLHVKSELGKGTTFSVVLTI